MRPAEPRLQRKLLAWLLGPLLVLLVLDTGATWWASRRFADLAHDRSLHEIARELALHVKAGEGGAPQLELTPGAERVLLGDADDKVDFRIAAGDGRPLGGEPSMPPPPQAGSTQAPQFYPGSLHGQPVRVASVWLPVEEGGGIRVQVQVAETLNKRHGLARDILFSALLPQLLLIGLAVAVVWFGISRGLLPLRRLRDALADRSHRDLSPLDTAGVPAEVRPLLDEVNQLMLRLGKTLDAQSRFIADAAHQLKTPVSGLKAQIELALRENDPERVRHSLAQLYVGVDRLSRLVRQLLSLARNEPGAAESLRMQPLDLAAFALEISMEWAPQALRQEIDLGFEGAEGPVVIDADQDRLRELVNNLIDNAVRYSRAGGRVTVVVAPPLDGQARLAVSDDGPRIPEEERTRIFERFHRLLGAPADGSGLGLAIVNEIATLHHARITLEEDADGVGNTFSVWFPLRKVAES